METEALRRELAKHPFVTKIIKYRLHGYRTLLTQGFYILPGPFPGGVLTSSNTEFRCLHLYQLKTFLENYTTQDETVYKAAVAAADMAAQQKQLEKEKTQRGSLKYVMSDEAIEKFPLVHEYMLRADSPFYRDAIVSPICKNKWYDTLSRAVFDVEAWQKSAVEVLEKKIAELEAVKDSILHMDVKATEEYLQGVQNYCTDYIEKGDEA
jgi:hypothetical protein